MTARIDISKHYGSGLVRGLLALGREVETAGIDKHLFELVKLRASQMNGCAYCLDMHTKDARALGENEQRIYALNAWRDTPFFSARERVALEWTEALTNLGGAEHVSEELYRRVVDEFGETDLLTLTFGVVVINAWNRVVAAAKPVVGSYVSPHAQTANA